MLLHNELQRRGCLNALRWVRVLDLSICATDFCSRMIHLTVFAMPQPGSQFAIVREARENAQHFAHTLFTVNNVEYGRCVSLTKQAARNEAARQALQRLGWRV